MASVFYNDGMAENKPVKSKGFSIDWLVKGSLTKVGDIFDRLTGRGWKPSSSLATSELIERMKSLMDSEVRENGDKRRYVPHNITLKMQWDKFSADSEAAMKKLENEFLIAAVDHINDRHYFTYSPLSISIKPDYFTSGVVLLVSFDKFEEENHEAAVNVTVDGLKKEEIMPEAAAEKRTGTLFVRFSAGGKQIERKLRLEEGKRLSVGRTKENDLQIDDTSISKAHASLLLNKAGKLVVADTGSTNGTFVNGERIAYGKAVELATGVPLMFGLINVGIDLQFDEAAKTEVLPPLTESYKVGEFEFTTRPSADPKAADVPAPTVASIPVHKESAESVKKTEILTIAGKNPEQGEIAARVAPQPELSEADIKIDKENRGSDNKN